MPPAITEIFKAGIAGITGVDLTKLPDGGFQRAWFDDDAEWDHGPMALPDEPSPFRGPDGIVKGWVRWLELWDEYTLVPTSIEAYSDTQLVLDFHTEAVGKIGRTPMSMTYSQVWTWRNGRVARVEFYENHEAAVEAISRSAPADAGDPRTPPPR
jgi:ketosteroid isomerase-like protein